MTATAKTTRKTVAQLLAEQADNLVPANGDRAFTVYHGLIWEGTLKQIEWNGKEGWGGTWVIVPADGKKVFDHCEGYYKYFERMPVSNVSVYGPAEYNITRGMFYLRAHED